jgi:hypothetical protein
MYFYEGHIDKKILDLSNLGFIPQMYFRNFLNLS